VGSCDSINHCRALLHEVWGVNDTSVASCCSLLLKAPGGEKRAHKNSKRVKPTFYGEALTKDEVFARTEEAKRAKEKKKQRQATRRKKQQKKTKQVEEINEEDSDNEAQANDTEDGGSHLSLHGV